MKRRHRLTMAMACLVLLCMTSAAAFGQAVYGSILGTVTDPQGAAVPNAKVTVTNQRKGSSDVTTTNADGNYSVTHLIPDTYSVKVEAPNFKTSEQKEVLVSADSGANVNLALQVGSTSESVEVTAEAPQLKTDRADVAVTFNAKYVEDLPVLNRNFTTFELLSPGTQKLVGWSHAATENPQGGQQIFVNGQHFSGTAFELDGTDNQDPILGIIVVNPNLDAVTETKIALQNYDAEFGKAVAGVVTAQTKSGSNDFHGSAFWFRRSDANQARDPYTQFQADSVTGRFIPPARWQQMGGSIGGPIIKDRLFFFGDYQATRQTVGITNQLTIPTSLVTSTCVAGGTNCDLSQYAPFIGNGTAGDPSNYLYDPRTGNLDGSGRLAFCGSNPEFAVSADAAANLAACATPFQIPISALSPQALGVLALFPSPSTSDVKNNFIGSGSGPFDQNSFDTRVDFVASQTLNVFGRFSLDYFKLSGQGVLGALGGVGNGLGGLAGSSVTHNYSLATGFTKTVSSTLLTDFRYGWFRYNPQTHKQFEGQNPMTDFGIPGMNFGDKTTSGLAAFFMDGTMSNFGEGLNVGRCNCPLTQREQQSQFVNNWTKIKGNHQIKFGADVRYATNLRVPSDANRTGQLNFNHQITSGGVFDVDPTAANAKGLGGLDLATFLLGDVSFMDRYASSSLNASEHQWRMFFYGQDTFRVTQKLTVNYGLRWELYTPEAVNAKGNGGFANLTQGVIRVAGYGGFGLNGNIENKLNAFAPRLGLSYQLNDKTVIRMGYGRSYDIGVFGSNFGHTVTQNLPVLINQNINATSNVDPTATNNIVPAFTLAEGPPAPEFPAIPSDGILPLQGPQNNVQAKIRPTKQVLPTLDAWNATLQRQLTNTMSLEVAYVANKGTHGFAGNGPSYDANQPSVVGFAEGVPQSERRPFHNRFTYPNFLDANGNPIVCCDGGFNYLGNDASSHYNALQVKLDKRFSSGLQFLTHYTYSRAVNYDGNYYNQSHAIANGPDDFNRNHVWVTNYVYELPFGRGKHFLGNANRVVDYAVGGWQVNQTWNLSSGLPWTPSFSACGGEQDVGVCRPNKGSGSFGVGAGHFDPITHSTRFFAPVADITTHSGQAFEDPGVGNLGNIGRNSYHGPRYFGSDLSVMKNFAITERFKAQFRMDAFNVFNHPVGGFSSTQGNLCIDCGGNAGLIQNLEQDVTMRQLQFALRLTF